MRMQYLHGAIREGSTSNGHIVWRGICTSMVAGPSLGTRDQTVLCAWQVDL